MTTRNFFRRGHIGTPEESREVLDSFGTLRQQKRHIELDEALQPLDHACQQGKDLAFDDLHLVDRGSQIRKHLLLVRDLSVQQGVVDDESIHLLDDRPVFFSQRSRLSDDPVDLVLCGLRLLNATALGSHDLVHRLAPRPFLP